MDRREAEPAWEVRSVASAMCVVEIVRRAASFSFSLPFLEGEMWGGGGSDLRSGRWLRLFGGCMRGWRGGTGRKGLNDSDCAVLEVDAEEELMP
jgi:hypothetical protein